MNSANTTASLWSAALRQRTVWSRAATVGLPVGCLQAAINQGDLWWEHSVTAGVIAKTIVSPLITFSVALISAAATWVEKQRSVESSRSGRSPQLRDRREEALTSKSPTPADHMNSKPLTIE